LNNNNGQKQPFWRGTLKPSFPRRARVPEFERVRICGKSGQLYSNLRLWVYGAVPEFPSVGIHISLSNGSGSAFTKVTADELHSLILDLQKWENELNLILPKLEAIAAAVSASRDQQDAMMNTIRRLQELGINEPETIESPDSQIPDDVLSHILQNNPGQIPLQGVRNYSYPNEVNHA